jgi:hypothetical protein
MNFTKAKARIKTWASLRSAQNSRICAGPISVLQASARETPLLALPRRADARVDRFRRFPAGGVRQLVVGHVRNLYMDVDAVRQWATAQSRAGNAGVATQLR